MVVMMGSEFD